jgi:hypothetical protein
MYERRPVYVFRLRISGWYKIMQRCGLPLCYSKCVVCNHSSKSWETGEYRVLVAERAQ